MKRHCLIAATAVLALLGTVANATILVYEGFHEGDWSGITATGSQQLQKGKTTGNYSTGFNANSSWAVADNTTQLSVSGTDHGLSLPAILTAKGFTTCGGAAQCNPSGFAADATPLRRTRSRSHPGRSTSGLSYSLTRPQPRNWPPSRRPPATRTAPITDSDSSVRHRRTGTDRRQHPTSLPVRSSCGRIQVASTSSRSASSIMPRSLLCSTSRNSAS